MTISHGTIGGFQAVPHFGSVPGVKLTVECKCFRISGLRLYYELAAIFFSLEGRAGDATVTSGRRANAANSGNGIRSQKKKHSAGSLSMKSFHVFSLMLWTGTNERVRDAFQFCRRNTFLWPRTPKTFHRLVFIIFFPLSH